MDIAARFKLFRENLFKENMGEEQHLHSRLELGLPLIFEKIKSFCMESDQGCVYVNGNRVMPVFNEPKQPHYIVEFDREIDPPVFRTQQMAKKDEVKKPKRKPSTAI